MRKALLMSILFMTLFIPIWLASAKNVRKGARSTIIYVVLFIALWAMLLAKVFWSLPASPKLVQPHSGLHRPAEAWAPATG